MTDLAADLIERPPKAPIEHRNAELVDVRFPDRIVEVMAMPYETPTNRVIHDGRQIVETVSRGAFGRLEHRHDVRCLRDHDRTRPAGKAIAFHTDRDDGLVVELRMSRTPIGDETLELAADGILAASVGFAPMVQRWTPDRKARRLEKCYLDHVGMLIDPAYPTATVLDVRRQAMVDGPVVATPNKDRVLALLFELRYSPDH
jgi:HK97 family phage prohead protease